MRLHVPDRRNLLLAVLSSSLLNPLPCLAAVTEPNGQVVPIAVNNGETSLQTFFASRGETIDWKADAYATPATFTPKSALTVTFVFNQAAYRYGLAWYNVDPQATTAPTGFVTLIPPNSALGTQVTGADIKNHPSYTGGDIGFALVGGETHYSEAQWNQTCTACPVPGPWILALVYRSTVTADAYYLAFEDGDVSSSSFNNDGDFNDDVFLVQDVVCSGSGESCEADAEGVCAAGETACDDGKLVCEPGPSAETEVCNGLDDNCNGETDEGLTFSSWYADADGDGYGDAASPTSTCGSEPPDGYVADNTDNCPGVSNPDQADLDADDLGDACDDDADGDGLAAASDCDDLEPDVSVPATWYADGDGDGYGDPDDLVQECTVTAPEGYVADNTDNCPDVSNPDQADSDNDGAGDACEDTPEPTPTPETSPTPEASPTPGDDDGGEGCSCRTEGPLTATPSGTLLLVAAGLLMRTRRRRASSR